MGEKAEWNSEWCFQGHVVATRLPRDHLRPVSCCRLRALLNNHYYTTLARHICVALATGVCWLSASRCSKCSGLAKLQEESSKLVAEAWNRYLRHCHGNQSLATWGRTKKVPAIVMCHKLLCVQRIDLYTWVHQKAVNTYVYTCVTIPFLSTHEYTYIYIYMHLSYRHTYTFTFTYAYAYT